MPSCTSTRPRIAVPPHAKDSFHASIQPAQNRSRVLHQAANSLLCLGRCAPCALRFIPLAAFFSVSPKPPAQLFIQRFPWRLITLETAVAHERRAVQTGGRRDQPAGRRAARDAGPERREGWTEEPHNPKRPFRRSTAVFGDHRPAHGQRPDGLAAGGDAAFAGAALTEAWCSTRCG